MQGVKALNIKHSRTHVPKVFYMNQVENLFPQIRSYYLGMVLDKSIKVGVKHIVTRMVLSSPCSFAAFFTYVFEKLW